MDAARTITREQLRTAHAVTTDGTAAAEEIISQLGDIDSAALQFFVSPAVDATPITRALGDRFPGTPTIGCTTAGEFNERGSGTGGVSVLSLPKSAVNRASAVLADLSQGVEPGIREAVGVLEAQLGISLREADPERYIGLVLIDGTHGNEERVNEVLGDIAPLQSFVGGSAGDDLAFTETRVFCGSDSTDHGAALMLLDMAVPFSIVKTCSFQSTGQGFTATRVDEAARVVWEFDGRPAAEVYAEAVGVPVDRLDSKVFMSHPVGLMIEGEPWIRSPQQVVQGGGIKFYCQILKDMHVELMFGTGMIADTRSALRTAAEQLGGRPSGAILFNCILRRLEMDEQGSHQEFLKALQGIPAAGFHTYGESWLGHMNQTLTAIMFG